MRKNIWQSLLLTGLLCAALTACSTAYAAGPENGSPKHLPKALTETEASEETAEEDTETVAEEDTEAAAEETKAASAAPKNASAQEALEYLRETLRPGKEIDSSRTVTVSASGSVSVVPDKVELSFGVNTEAKTPEEAQQKNAESIRKVIDHLTEMGIEEKSIQTSGYSLYPNYDYSGNTRKLIGYQVSTMLSVRDQAVDDAGKIISECVAAGINDVNNFRFYASSYDEAYEEALQKAVAAASRKAEVLALSAGSELGPVLSLTEGYQDTSVRYAKANYAMEEAAAMSTMDLALMPGENQITAQVTVTYVLK